MSWLVAQLYTDTMARFGDDDGSVYFINKCVFALHISTMLPCIVLELIALKITAILFKNVSEVDKADECMVKEQNRKGKT